MKFVFPRIYDVFQQAEIKRYDIPFLILRMGNNPMVGATVACAVAVKRL